MEQKHWKETPVSYKTKENTDKLHCSLKSVDILINLMNIDLQQLYSDCAECIS